MEEKMLQRVHEQNLYNWDHLQNGFKNRQKDQFTGILKEIIYEDSSNRQ